MGRRRNQPGVARLRREGVRATAGPWALCAGPAQAGGGRLTVALGRRAGRAVVRSRIRRMARDILGPRHDWPMAADLLLLARADISTQPRRQVRATLQALLARVLGVLARRGTEGPARG